MKKQAALPRFHILHSHFCLPKMPGRLIRRTAPFEGAYAGANPAPAAKLQPVSSKSERQFYKLRTLESYQHGPPVSAAGNFFGAGLLFF